MFRSLIVSLIAACTSITTQALAVEFTIEEERSWRQGDGKRTNLRVFAHEGFCFLTGVAGDFEGGGEQVNVYVDGSRWFLSGESRQEGLAAWARCVTVSPASTFELKKQRFWRQHLRARSLDVRKDEGFCFLAGMKGKFEGGGERVSVYLDGDTWILDGRSDQEDVAAWAQCLTMSKDLFEIEDEEHFWTQGRDSSSGYFIGMNKSDGFCFLSSVSGKFEGGGEEIRLRIVWNKWKLSGRSGQEDVVGRAKCIKLFDDSQ